MDETQSLMQLASLTLVHVEEMQTLVQELYGANIRTYGELKALVETRRVELDREWERRVG